MRKLDLVFFDAGGGHRSAANALKAVAGERYPDWDIRLMNLQELLDPIDIFRKITGLRLQDVYNTLLEKGWTLGTTQMLPLMHLVIRVLHGRQLPLIAEYWRRSQPDLVVSLIPNFNRAVFQSLAAACPGVPMVTILTDMADYPPHFWLERQDQYAICGTEKARVQALEHGLQPDRAFRTSGMILNPRFYEPIEKDRAEERRSLGLDPSTPTALVLFGGQGSSAMVDIVKRLDAAGLDIQLILVCGHNAKLAAKLKALRTRIRIFVEGFTREIPRYMFLSDFLIGKPGPGSVSEALAMRLPVIVERNSWTMPQERFNTVWITEKQVGLVLPSFRHIGTAVRTILDPATLERFRANASAMNNQAVFEIPPILEAIMERHK
jgi:1,2-diacylglycerol 3-beta-galactosyltransferase